MIKPKIEVAKKEEVVVKEPKTQHEKDIHEAFSGTIPHLHPDIKEAIKKEEYEKKNGPQEEMTPPPTPEALQKATADVREDKSTVSLQQRDGDDDDTPLTSFKSSLDDEIKKLLAPKKPVEVKPANITAAKSFSEMSKLITDIPAIDIRKNATNTTTIA